jgi:hypothetical protein
MLCKVNIRIPLLFLALLVGCSPVRGCIDSSFGLSPESPIPIWFKLPGDKNRKDVTVSMDYWSGPFGRTATFTLRDDAGRELDRVTGTKFGSHPIRSNPGGATYPSYELITSEGVLEVIEHRRMEPIFYVNRDRAVRERLEKIAQESP